MAWEWVAPVAGSVATVVVGVTGIVATYKAGSRQQATALAAAQQQSDAQVAVAREERQQRRLEAAYSELLAAITEMRYWEHTVYPLLTKPGQSPMPPRPALPDPAKKEALWTAYWSPRVEQLMEDWQAAVRGLENAGFGIAAGQATEERGQPSGIDVHGLLLEIPERKQKVLDADKRIREQIRLELLGKHDGHAEEVTTEPPPPS